MTPLQLALLCACYATAALSRPLPPSLSYSSSSYSSSSSSSSYSYSSSSSTITIPPSDPNWYFTEFNWGKGEGYVQAVNPGAYFKVGFTGTSVGVTFDFKGAYPSNYSTIRYVIDDLPENEFHLPLPNGATTITLASNLQSTNHSLYFFIRNSLQSADRWNTPQCVVRITGLVIDSGSKTLPLPLRPYRMLVYWDSIGEGVSVLDLPGGDLVSNDATSTWAFSLAAGLQAEVSMAAFGRLGWTIDGNGNVPPVYTPGNDTNSSWNKIDSAHARNFSGQLDFIVIGHGTNDGLNNRPTAAIQESAFSWLLAQRSVVTSKTAIILTIPFGGFERDVLYDAFEAYQAKYNDPFTYLLDLGAPATSGLTHFQGGGTWESGDGIHPVVWRDGQLGAMLTLGIYRLITGNRN